MVKVEIFGQAKTKVVMKFATLPEEDKLRLLEQAVPVMVDEQLYEIEREVLGQTEDGKNLVKTHVYRIDS